MGEFAGTYLFWEGRRVEPGLSFFFVKSGLTTFLRCKQKILQCYNNLSNIHLQQALFFHVHMFLFFFSFFQFQGCISISIFFFVFSVLEIR